MKRKLGLVIGNSAYRDSTLARLATPDVDVGDLADILLDPEIGAFDDVKVLVNASSYTIRRAISNFFAAKDREDLLLLYFSGHGVLDIQGQLFLAVKDTERALLRATAISAAFITEEMNNSRSKRQLLILDCCHSGAFARGSKGSPGASVGTGVAFEGTGYGRVVLTATDATQYAWEGDQAVGEPVNSVFTHHMIAGLKTGQADTNQDGLITIDELYDYVYDQVVRETPKQTPGKWTYREQGEIVIAQNPLWKQITSLPEQIGEVDKDVDQQLAALYTRGLSAYWLEEWDKAQTAFNAILEIQPDYKDAQTKLDEAVRQDNLQVLYQQGKHASEIRDWQAAIEAFKSIQAEDPEYKETTRLLETAQKEKRLKDLYAEAKQLFEAGQYQAVINVFQSLEAEQPGFQDPEDLLEKAGLKQQAIETQKALQETYNQALLELDAGKLPQARQLLQRVQTMQPGYEDTERLLAWIEAQIKPLEKVSPEPGASADPSAAAGAGTLQVSRLLSLETLRGWVEDLRAGPIEKAASVVVHAGEIAQPPDLKTVSLPGIADSTVLRILLISAGWFIAYLFKEIPGLQSIPNLEDWLYKIDAFYNYQLGIDGVQFVLISGIAGLLSGIILWLGVRSKANIKGTRYLLLLAGSWLVAFLTASSLAVVWRDSLQFLGWFFAGILGGVLGGLFTGLSLWRFSAARRQKVMYTVIGCALGLGIGFLIGELSGGPFMDWVGEQPGWILSRRFGNALAGLVVAWVLLDERIVKNGLKVNWRTVLIGVAGFFIAALPLNVLFQYTSVYDGNFLIYLGLMGLFATAFLVLPSKKPKRIILFGLLGGASLIVVNILFTLLTGEGIDILAPTFWGLGLGVALGISTRRPSLVIMLGLLSMAAFTLTFIYSFASIPDVVTSPILFSLVWGLNGGFLAFLYQSFVLPDLAIRES